MDESLSQNGPGSGMNNNNNINNTGGGGGNLVTNNKVGDDLNGAVVNNVAQYTIPGVLHFIQHEWTRFELERSQWDVDRAELQARIAVLLGERKGQESLKSDLIRRIKMLEYALKQERVKFHRLKYGCDPPNSMAADMMKPPTTTDDGTIASELAPDADVPFSTVSNITWRQGRQLLRQYLQEVGYTEAIIDVRSNRVRSLLGLNRDGHSENLDENYDTNVSNNNAMDTQKRMDDGSPVRKTQHAAMAEAMLLETEAAVLANFEFLAQADSEITDDDDMNDGLEISDMVGFKGNVDKRKGTDDVDAEANDVLNELNLLTEGEKASLAENRINDGDWGFNKGSRHTIPGMGTTGDDDIDQSLGELAQLTVNNDSETAYDDTTNSKEPYRKTWNAKYTLRSHFDCVRALAFHPTEPVLITGSEDHTLKLWNLQKTVPAKKSANLDVEPLYTFRGHSSEVLCLAINASGEQCYSGSLDGIINCWNLPNSNIDPYDNYDAEIMREALEGHSDSVWGLSVHNTKGTLLSASADGTVKLWSPLDKTPLLQTFVSDEASKDRNPTSVDFVHDELDRIVTAYQSSNCVIYDTETCKPVLRFEAHQETVASSGANSNHLKYIYKVISHPTLPIIITAHEDRHIRFWDSKNGSLIHSMVAHLEAVTSLAIDSHGLYLLSGSHDCSIRLWNMDTKTCVQEITAHRKKFDESIFDVAFHPSKPYIASAGADAIAKVFV